MKKFLALTIVVLAGAVMVRAQDAATYQRVREALSRGEELVPEGGLES